MILLEPQSNIVQTTLTEKFADQNISNPRGFDVQFVDFDGVRFHLSTLLEDKGSILLSMGIRCWEELVRYSADSIIRREYAQWLAPSVEPDYNVSLLFDLKRIPANPEEKEALIRSVALLKRNALAAPFERAFTQQKELESKGTPTDGSAPPIGELMQVHYRDEEAIYVQAAMDRVTVIFSTIFREEVDRIYGKVFLQEFVDARRLPTIQQAPQVLYSTRDPPLEIRQVPGLKLIDEIGYVTFVLFPQHFSPETITHIQLFRDYLHYHIKCSKAYMHSRMRFRVKEFQKILNRAKLEAEPTADKERKTITGRTLVTR